MSVSESLALSLVLVEVLVDLYWKKDMPKEVAIAISLIRK